MNKLIAATTSSLVLLGSLSSAQAGAMSIDSGMVAHGLGDAEKWTKTSVDPLWKSTQLTSAFAGSVAGSYFGSFTAMADESKAKSNGDTNEVIFGLGANAGKFFTSKMLTDTDDDSGHDGTDKISDKDGEDEDEGGSDDDKDFSNYTAMGNGYMHGKMRWMDTTPWSA